MTPPTAAAEVSLVKAVQVIQKLQTQVFGTPGTPTLTLALSSCRCLHSAL
jgi:hypothetical protein